MPPSSSAMELKVLINILQSGQGLQSILNQVNQVSTALTKLQAQANSSQPGGQGAAIVNKAAGASNQAGVASRAAARGMAEMGKEAGAAVIGITAFEGAVMKAYGALKFLAGGFLGLQAVQFVKSLADSAARTQVLDTVLHVIALNAGVTGAAIEKVSRNVQRLGITSDAANQSLSQFLQAGLDVKFAEPLARAAQDLAVIANQDSSQTFGRLILNIQQLDTMGLRWMGIVVSMEEATNKYAAAHNKVASSLSQTEKQQALLNEVLEKARGLAGAYEAAMGDVGKQITSLKRYWSDLTATLGDQLLPAYSRLIANLSVYLAKANDVAKAQNANMTSAEALADAIDRISKAFFELLLFLQRHATALKIVVGVWLAFKTAFVWAPAAAAALFSVLDPLFLALTSGIEIVLSLSAAFLELGASIGIVGTLLTGGVLLLIAAIVAGIGYALYRVTRGSAEAVKQAGELSDITTKLSKARDDEEEAKRKATEARISGTYAEEKAAEEAYNQAKARRKALEDEEFAYLDKLRKMDPQRYLLEQHQASINAAKRAYDKLGVELTAIRKKLDVDIHGAEVLPKDFATALADLHKLGEGWDGLTASIQRAAEEQEKFLRPAPAHAVRTPGVRVFTPPGPQGPQGQPGAPGQVMEPMAPVPSHMTPQQEADYKAKQEQLQSEIAQAKVVAGATSSLDSLRKLVDDKDPKSLRALRLRIQQEGPALGLDVTKMLAIIDEAFQIAGINAVEGERRWRAPIDALRMGKFKADRDMLQTAKEVEISTVKSLNQEMAVLDKERYERGMMSAQEYYARRRQASEAEFRYELEQAMLARDTIVQEHAEKGKSRGFQFTEAETAEYKASLAKADAKIQSVRDQRGPKIAEDRAQEEADIRTKTAAITEGRLATAAGLGDERAARDQIDTAFERRREQLGQGGLEVAQAERLVALQKLSAEQAEKRLDLSLESVRVAREGIAISQAELDVATKRTDALLETGEITKLEGDRRKNAEVLKQRSLDEATLLTKQVELVQRRLAYEYARAEIVRLMASQNKAADSPETLQKINEQLGNSRSTIQGLEVDIRNLAGAIETASAKLVRYGKELREAFTSGLADVLTEALTGVFNHYEGFIESIQKFGINLAKKVASMYARHLAESITQALVNATSDKYTEKNAPRPDMVGKSIPGTGIFDKVFKILGMDTEKLPKGTDQDPIYVWMKNPIDPSQWGQQLALPQVPGGGLTNQQRANAALSTGMSIGQSLVGTTPFAGLAPMIPVIGRAIMDALLKRGAAGPQQINPFPILANPFAEGGVVSGPGSGTSDSVPILASTGEHIMPAHRAAQWMPVLEGIRTGRIRAFGNGGVVQPLALSSVIPRRYAAGGVVVADGGAGAVQTGGGAGNMVVTMHPDTLNMTMRDWLEHEVVRQQGRR